MENRFTVKDFLLFGLLAALVLVVVLAMVQYDRQWDTLRSIDGQLTRLNQQAAAAPDPTRELAAIRRALERGGGTRVDGASPNPSPTTRDATAVDDYTGVGSVTLDPNDAADPFAGLREAMASPDYARGDWYVAAFGAKLSKLTPLLSSDAIASVVQARVLEALAYRDPDTLEWVPQLATKWDVSDDGTTFTFDLRRGVTFSDGEPFTAADVVFTYDWIMDPAVDAPRARAYYERIASVVAEGDHRVVFTFAEPYFEAFDLCAGLSAAQPGVLLALLARAVQPDGRRPDRHRPLPPRRPRRLAAGARPRSCCGTSATGGCPPRSTA